MVCLTGPAWAAYGVEGNGWPRHGQKSKPIGTKETEGRCRRGYSEGDVRDVRQARAIAQLVG